MGERWNDVFACRVRRNSMTVRSRPRWLSRLARNHGPHPLARRRVSLASMTLGVGALWMSWLACGWGSSGEALAESPDPTDVYSSRVQPLFERYCVSCHDSEESKGELNLESYSDLLRGGENGPVFVPGESDASRLVRMLDGRDKPRMPPGRRKKPSPDEIAVIAAWIDAGASAPPAASSDRDRPRDPARFVTPSVESLDSSTPAHSVALSSLGDHIAVGRYRSVELRDAATDVVLRRFGGLYGAVHAVGFSRDARRLYGAGGEPGLVGEARVWRLDRRNDLADGDDGILFRGHTDAIYAADLTADGRILATGSYDHSIVLWDVATGSAIRTLAGHNGAVFAVAFRADGNVLGSASYDGTVKLWSVATGERLETFSESSEPLYALAFTPDGLRVAAGGEDHRIRMWSVSASAAEGTNSLLVSRFAHEGSILDLAFSADGESLVTLDDDRGLKLWAAADITERLDIERASVDPTDAGISGVAFAPNGDSLALGRLDGAIVRVLTTNGRQLRLAAARDAALGHRRSVLASFSISDEASTKAEGGDAPAEKPPTLSSVEPWNVSRGASTAVVLRGERLDRATRVRTSLDAVTARVLSTEDERGTVGELRVELSVTDEAPRASVELWCESPAGESSRVRIFVDDLPVVAELPTDSRSPGAQTIETLPVSVAGRLERPGDVDRYAVELDEGDVLVADLEGQRIDSDVDARLSVLDERGRILAVRNDAAGRDPFVSLTAPRRGRYTVTVADLSAGGSPNHRYRLSLGSIPYVTAVFPLGVLANSTADVELVGRTIPAATRTSVAVGDVGEREVPLPAGFRSLGRPRVRAVRVADSIEVEPNDSTDRATPIDRDRGVSARIDRSGDRDVFRFECDAGSEWVIETDADRLGSPVDTRIEVLAADGTPIVRTLLRATRDSRIDFRSIDANSADVRVDNWEEMHLDQFLYLSGEVTKIFRMPQGPDSGLVLYRSSGKRRGYFGTSPTTHSAGESCYIVEPHAPGASFPATGLPVIPIYYENDDDSLRGRGRDSRLLFRAPSNGAYFVRVSNVQPRGGPDHGYRLVVRRARPDVRLRVGGRDAKVPAGSGQSFTVTAERIDGFEGPVRVEVTGVPERWRVTTPLVIQSGHETASGTIVAPGSKSEAVPSGDEPWSQIQIRGFATIDGRDVERDAGNLGTVTLAGDPPLRVQLRPLPLETSDDVPVIEIRPGAEARAVIDVERLGHKGLVSFSVDNLPHGVIVNDIGLNGVLIRADETRREIFLHCEAWVPATERLCFAVSKQAGRQTSAPVLLRVIR